MKKKLLFFAVTVMALALPLTASAYNFSYTYQGKTLYYIITNNSQHWVTVIGHINNIYVTGEVVIPNTVVYNGVTYTVKAIGNNAFSHCSGLTSVTIPDGITTIGYMAFSHCSGLTSVTIGNGVTSIDDYAFYNCYGLSSVTIPDGVTTIPSCCFENCSGLTSVTIPDGVISIGTKAFLNCSSLTSVIIPDGVTAIESHTFSGCSGLISVTIPDRVTSIGSYAFQNCSGLKFVTIGSGVTSINDWAFYGCSKLASITIPDGVTSIGSYAFQNCRSLASITIGSGVASIGNDAFFGCNGIADITSRARVAPTLGTDAFSGVTTTIPVTVPCGSLMSYYSRWPYFSDFIESAGFSFSVQSADNSTGTVTVLTVPTCHSPHAVFNASANIGYRFNRWSDGNTDNPRALTLTQDTVIIAYFVRVIPDTVLIGDVETANIRLYQREGNIVVEGAEGMNVTLYDAVGRVISGRRRVESGKVEFAVPSSGVYLVRVGDHPARRVVVIR